MVLDWLLANSGAGWPWARLNPCSQTVCWFFLAQNCLAQCSWSPCHLLRRLVLFPRNQTNTIDFNVQNVGNAKILNIFFLCSNFYHNRTVSGLQDNVQYHCLSNINMSGHLTCTSGKCLVHCLGYRIMFFSSNAYQT